MRLSPSERQKLTTQLVTNKMIGLAEDCAEISLEMIKDGNIELASEYLDAAKTVSELGRKFNSLLRGDKC